MPDSTTPATPATPPATDAHPYTIEADRIVARQSIELRPFPDRPSVGLCIRPYKFGICIEAEGLTPPQNQIEFFVNNGKGPSDGTGTNMAAVLTLLAGPDANFVQLRFPGDANSLIFKMSQGVVTVTTEQPNTPINIAPQGQLKVHNNLVSDQGNK